MTLIQQFGASLREARLKLGISQEELAMKAEVDRTYVSGIERGRRNPSLLMMGRLADALGLPLKDLLAGLEPQQPKDTHAVPSRRCTALR